MITAKVIADSVGYFAPRLTTLQLTYPRFIHAEFMTHRVFSRCASSSRAIPSKRIRAAIRKERAMPVYWGANQKGMQAAQELTGFRKMAATMLWSLSVYPMLFVSWLMEKVGLHKQIANRILEPWSHITVVVTSTEWTNFFALRIHKDAQPEMRRLAEAIYDAMEASTPKLLRVGDWHLPYLSEEEISGATGLSREHMPQCSAARCARTSYLNQEGKRPPLAEDLGLFSRLVARPGEPKHASPTEHQAMVPYTHLGEDVQPLYPSNLRGWVQHRKLIEGENITTFKRKP